jgi:LmbE family N-acetylglucosaminyl deacetylase
LKVLVVASHPDDEVLGCGGTIARLAREQHEVHLAILGEGITSRYQQREAADPKLLKNLHECSRKAAQLLGASDTYLYNLPDNQFDTVPLLEVVKIIERLMERLQPQVIYTHHGGDLNIDHALTFRAVLTATRPVAGNSVEQIYAFEVPSSTEWAFGQLQPSFRANVFMDISNTLETKIKAIQAYEDEIRPFPHPRSPEALRAIAKRWGSVAGLEASEAFELVRLIR